MECCSPDVGDCQKCHPELWIVTKNSWVTWKPKIPKVKKTRRKRMLKTDLHKTRTK
jgi:hypothetical protein